MIDVSTTQRKALTPTQRLKLFEAHNGICALCGVAIRPGEKWRDEHLRPLALGGSNDMENRAPVHFKCAKAKDAEDLTRIAKAKRQKRASIGIAPQKQKIASRGFPPSGKTPRIDKGSLPPLPPRAIYR